VRRCQCQERRIATARIRTILADWPEYAEADLESFNPKNLRQTDALEKLRSNPGGSYFLTGIYACGKTHLLVAQYRALALRGDYCLLRSGKQLADEMRLAEIAPADGQQPRLSLVLEAARTAEKFHLFYDDIEKAGGRTEFRAEAIFDLVDTLWRRQLSLTVTSNLTLDQLRSSIGDAAVARIDRICTQIRL
jgi:DNA replication protein DnaC